MWFYNLLYLHGELPMSQGFKQANNLNEQYISHFPSPSLCVPDHQSWVGSGCSLSSWLWCWPRAVQVVQPSPLLQMMQCLHVGFGTDKEGTSALRCCCCSAGLGTCCGRWCTNKCPNSWHTVSWKNSAMNSCRNSNRCIYVLWLWFAKSFKEVKEFPEPLKSYFGRYFIRHLCQETEAMPWYAKRDFTLFQCQHSVNK